MRLSRVGILIVISSIILVGANCSYYNRLIARRNVVDGAIAYKAGKFPDAEGYFRKAVSLDPEGKSEEGRTARLFLARTLHAQYLGNRTGDAAKAMAEEAIKNYRLVLADDVNDQGSFKAVANLYETLASQNESERDKWAQDLEKWRMERAENANVVPKYRADAYASLAAKQYSCANELSDIPDKVKKTVKKDGKDVFQFVKPENPADYTKFTECVQKGVELIDKAVALENEEAKNAKSVEVKPLTLTDLAKLNELVKIWGKVWSYKSSLMNQSLRWADMDGRTPDKDSFKAKADEAKAKFLEYTQIEKKIDTEKDERIKAADPTLANTSNTNATNAANAANTTNANTKK